MRIVRLRLRVLAGLCGWDAETVIALGAPLRDVGSGPRRYSRQRPRRLRPPLVGRGATDRVRWAQIGFKFNSLHHCVTRYIIRPVLGCIDAFDS